MTPTLDAGCTSPISKLSVSSASTIAPGSWGADNSLMTSEDNFQFVSGQFDSSCWDDADEGLGSRDLTMPLDQRISSATRRDVLLQPSLAQSDLEEGRRRPRVSSVVRPSQRERSAEVSIPMDRSFLFLLRQEESIFGKTTVTVPKDFTPGQAYVSITVDGKIFDIEAPPKIQPGDKMAVYLPRPLPLSASAKREIMQEVRRPLLYNPAQCVADPEAVGVCATTPCDDNIRLRLLQYKALQGRSMEPGVKTIAETCDDPRRKAAALAAAEAGGWLQPAEGRAAGDGDTRMSCRLCHVLRRAVPLGRRR